MVFLEFFEVYLVNPLLFALFLKLGATVEVIVCRLKNLAERHENEINRVETKFQSERTLSHQITRAIKRVIKDTVTYLWRNPSLLDFQGVASSSLLDSGS